MATDRLCPVTHTLDTAPLAGRPTVRPSGTRYSGGVTSWGRAPRCSPLDSRPGGSNGASTRT